MNVFQNSGSTFKNRSIAGILMDGQARSIHGSLSDDQLRSVVPSAFAEGAHQSRSERYAYIPTIQVIQALRSEGFLPVAAAQSKARDEGKRDFTKHMIRFRRHDADLYDDRSGVPETVLINSHDGSSSYWLLEGAFRAACKNGLIIASGSVQGVKVNHSGKVIDRVVEGSYQVIENATRAIEVSRNWAQIDLKPAEQMVFARAAAQLRFDAESQRVEPAELIRVRREADQGNDLWTVFNRAQEGLIRGGQQYRSQSGRRLSARPVGSIDRNVGLNQALWTLGEEMARLKA